MSKISPVKAPVKTGPKRRYDASSRRMAARATRRRILDSAHRLFLERGYAATTVAEIAESAGVSIETIYPSVGSKAALVRYLIETALSGAEEPVPPEEREGVEEIRAEPNPRRKVQLFARMVRPMLERLGPIWTVVLEAAPTDAKLGSLVQELRERHVGSMRLVAEHLAAAGGLRPDLSPDIAADVLWATNSPEFFRLLVAGRGWTGDAFESWLADAWQRILLVDGQSGS